MKAPVEITTPFPTVWETARTLGVSKKRVAELEALSGWGPTRPSFLRQLKTGTTEILLLAILSRGDRCVSEISQEAKDKSAGFFQFDEEFQQPTLRRMEDANLITGGWQGANGGEPRRKYYRITKQGREKLKASLESWNEFRKRFSRMLQLVG